MIKQVYLTKRILAGAIRKAFKARRQEAMELMGYVIEAKGNYIVKVWASGKVERLKKFRSHKKGEKSKIILD